MHRMWAALFATPLFVGFHFGMGFFTVFSIKN